MGRWWGILVLMGALIPPSPTQALEPTEADQERLSNSLRQEESRRAQQEQAQEHMRANAARFTAWVAQQDQEEANRSLYNRALDLMKGLYLSFEVLVDVVSTALGRK